MYKSCSVPEAIASGCMQTHLREHCPEGECSYTSRADRRPAWRMQRELEIRRRFCAQRREAPRPDERRTTKEDTVVTDMQYFSKNVSSSSFETPISALLYVSAACQNKVRANQSPSAHGHARLKFATPAFQISTATDVILFFCRFLLQKQKGQCTSRQQIVE